MRALAAASLALALIMPAVTIAADAPKPAAAAATAGQVDINRASLDELKALKGIGDVRAAAIVKGRPYARKDDLVRRGIIPESVYNEVREQIIAKQ